MGLLAANRFVGKMVRLPLKVIPTQLTVRILSGPLKGYRWISGSGPHGFWFGTVDKEKMAICRDVMRPGQTVIDAGANVGLYSLLFDKLMQHKGRVIAVEPSPRNIDYLQKHLALNDIKSVEISAVALSDQPGHMRFIGSGDPVAMRLAETGDTVVPVTTVDLLAEKLSLSALHMLKIDVEGAELKLLVGAEATIARHKPIILIETHERFVAGVHQGCIDWLTARGYSVTEYGTDHPPTELLAKPV